MQPAPADNLHDAIAALIWKARLSGKPQKAQVKGFTVKMSPNESRLELQVWKQSGDMLTGREIERVSRAAGMVAPICREINTEAGVVGLYIRDKADWAHICPHDWNAPETVDTKTEKSSFQTCRVCGSVIGTLEKKRSKKGPRQIYNGWEVDAAAVRSLTSSGPLPLDLTAEQREAALAAVAEHTAAVLSRMNAAAPPPVNDVPPWIDEAAAAPPIIPPEVAPDDPAPAAEEAPERPAEPRPPPGPYKPGLPYPAEAGKRVSGVLYWVDLPEDCVAFFRLEWDVIGEGKDKTVSEHFASGYILTPAMTPIPGSNLSNREAVHFERLTAPALKAFLKKFRLASAVTVDK